MSGVLIRSAFLRAGTAASARHSAGLSTSARLGLKESSSQNPDTDYEKHKHDSLSKQKSGRGHWKPELASDSEEAVKADRASHDVPSESAAVMQERTKHAAEETSRAGTSMRDGM